MAKRKSHTTPVPQSVRDRVDAEIARCKKIAEDHFGERFPTPLVDYDLRGTTAGVAYDWERRISLNSILLMENLNDGFVEGPDSTVAHEYAHIVDGIANPHTRESRLRNGRRMKRSVHGPTWKRIMRLFGCNAVDGRCHNYDVTNAKTRIRAKHEWRCVCGGKKMMMSNKTHKRMLENNKSYWMRGHKNCGGYNYHGTIDNLSETPIVTPKSAPKMPLAARGPATPTKDLGVKTPRQARKLGFTKLQLAQAIYKMKAGTLSRQEIIRVFMAELDMSKAGASTYYYKVSK